MHHISLRDAPFLTANVWWWPILIYMHCPSLLQYPPLLFETEDCVVPQASKRYMQPVTVEQISELLRYKAKHLLYYHKPVPSPKLPLDCFTLFLKRMNDHVEGGLASFGGSWLLDLVLTCQDILPMERYHSHHVTKQTPTYIFLPSIISLSSVVILHLTLRYVVFLFTYIS